MKTILLLLVLATMFGGCTERVSIEPEYTGDTDWEPFMTLTGNNYQRFAVEFTLPPRLELERNLLRYVFELQSAGETGFVPVDTIDLPYNVLYTRLSDKTYVSPPVLQQNAGYFMRMAVQYRNGTERKSSLVAFLAPAVKGKVLRRLPVTEPSYCGNCPPYDFKFGIGGLYVLKSLEHAITRIDTVSGRETLVTNLPQLNNDRFSVEYFNMAVHGDLIILTEHPRDDPNRMILVRLNSKSGSFDRSLKITLPNGVYSGRVIHAENNTVAILWNFGSGFDYQIVKLNLNTGQIVESFPRLTFDFGLFQDYLTSDGSTFWLARNVAFDNRIMQFDPATGTLSLPQRNPIFMPAGLVWDGKNFWVYDTNPNSFVKLRLEGL